MKEWKVRFFLDGCDCMYDDGLRSESYTEVDMPFIPRKGEFVWLPERGYDELEMHVAKCWEKKKCKNCPFMYCSRESVEDISAADYIIVKNIIYSLGEKAVMIALSDS